MIDVSEDPELGPQEKETIIKWSNDDSRATVHSEQASVVRWLIRHPAYRETDSRVTDGVQHATTGTLPIGAVKLSGHPRKSNQPSGVTGTLPNDDND